MMLTAELNKPFSTVPMTEKTRIRPDAAPDTPASPSGVYMPDDRFERSAGPSPADGPRSGFETAKPSDPQRGFEPADTVFVPMALWKNRQVNYNGDGDRVELDGRLRGKGPESGKLVADEIREAGECKTCENRKYVDRSDDSSVSFQTPTKLNPSTAARAVAAHENEHVTNERSRAERKGHKIVSQTVSFQYSTCPECGTSYISGGTTRTRSRQDSGEEEKPQNAEGAGHQSH